MAKPRENSTSFTRLQPCYLINSQVWHVPPQPKKQKRRNPEPPFEVWFVLTSCKKNRSESSGWVWEVCLMICFFWETSVCFGESLLWNIQFVLWLCGPCWWLLLNTLNVCSFPSSDLVGIWPNVLSPLVWRHSLPLSLSVSVRPLGTCLLFPYHILHIYDSVISLHWQHCWQLVNIFTWPSLDEILRHVSPFGTMTNVSFEHLAPVYIPAASILSFLISLLWICISPIPCFLRSLNLLWSSSVTLRMTLAASIWTASPRSKHCPISSMQSWLLVVTASICPVLNSFGNRLPLPWQPSKVRMVMDQFKPLLQVTTMAHFVLWQPWTIPASIICASFWTKQLLACITFSALQAYLQTQDQSDEVLHRCQDCISLCPSSSQGSTPWQHELG